MNTIGITIGDPGGIGPEITAKALARTSVRQRRRFVLIGDGRVLTSYGMKRYKECRIHDIRPRSSVTFRPGRTGKDNGVASLEYLMTAVDLLKQGDIQGLVTAPVCKESIAKVDKTFHGHTEFLADAFDQKQVGMLFVAGPVRTIIVTRHIPLAKVVPSLSSASILDTIIQTDTALRRQFAIRRPRIAVCGINPHAGEGGLIGKEDERLVTPAVKQARRRRIQADGPLAADTLFVPHNAARYDAIVSMYHDQGLTPVKAMYFERLVNCTIGLPFVRTSPAHGTAFDIAGQNKADPSSMIAAVNLACQLVHAS